MNLKKIENLELIINNSLGGDDNPIPYLWMSIADNNQSFEIIDIHKAFILTIEFLLDNKIVILAGAYDDQNKKEVTWHEGTDKLITNLEKFIYSYNERDFDKDPLLLFSFEYCFMKEIEPWPINVAKYDPKLVCKSNKCYEFWNELSNGTYNQFITETAKGVLKERF